MSATYNEDLSSDKDWVRFLIGDTVTATAALDDDTILAVLAAEPNKYFAAARCGEAASARWMAAAGGLLAKVVDDLHIKWGATVGAAEAYAAYLKSLRAKGAQVLSPKPYALKML